MSLKQSREVLTRRDRTGSDRGNWNAKLKELIGLELQLVLTFVNIAHTKYSMGNITGGLASRNNAEKSYRIALNYFEELSDVTSVERRKLMGLIKNAKDAITTLPEAPIRE
jgi:hypothetical protein